MDAKEAYKHWAQQYDTNHNRTRDLEAIALREMLENVSFDSCLEIGCGTGKNTLWLQNKAQRVLAVDLSEEMLQKAQEKVTANHVRFQQADIRETWTFAADTTFDLVGFSLVLEHIEDLDDIFKKTAQSLKKGGFVYVGELHPFKQYLGTKARFETPEGTQEVTCFTHHVSEFTQLAEKYGFAMLKLREYFDENDHTGIPRILALLFQKVI